MTTLLKDALFDALTDEIGRAAPEPRRPHRRTAIAVAAAGVLVAGAAGAVVVAGGDGSSDVTVTPADDTTAPPTTGVVRAETPDDVIPDWGYVFGERHGTVWRVPSMWASDLMAAPTDPPAPDPSQVGFRLAGSDARLAGMLVHPASPNAVLDDIPTREVATIGTRVLTTLADVTYPPGMDESTSTGPYWWTEADGTKWEAIGLLADLRLALPDLRYEGGKMVPGGTLLLWMPTPYTTTEVLRIRDDMFELTVVEDPVTDLTFVDPGRGRYELVDVGGHPGAFTTSGLSWRVDPSTVVTISRSLNRGFTPGPSNDELLAAARAVRTADHDELAALRVFRGATGERVVVYLPVGTVLRTEAPDPTNPNRTIGTGASVIVDDLDGDHSMGLGPDDTWTSIGGVVPIPAEATGHRYRIRYVAPGEQGRYVDGLTEDACTVDVTIPAEGEPPAEVHLTTEGC